MVIQRGPPRWAVSSLCRTPTGFRSAWAQSQYFQHGHVSQSSKQSLFPLRADGVRTSHTIETLDPDSFTLFISAIVSI